MSNLGELLKNLRGKQSLRDVADITELSHTYISDMEKGFRRGSKKPINPSPDTLKRLAEAYNYPYEDLMKAAGYIEDLSTAEDKEFESWLANPADARFFEEYNQAPEERRAALRDMWEILKKQGKD